MISVSKLKLKHPPKNWRYERKFIVEDREERFVEFVVKKNPHLFTEVYAPRQVNNLYFDFIERTCYNDNIIGYCDRFKLRLRWYGTLKGARKVARFELKVKEGMCGYKISFDTKPIRIGDTISLLTMQEMLLQSSLPAWLKQKVKLFNLTTVNSYWRRYFLSQDKKFRITIDTRIQYYKAYGNTVDLTRKNILNSKQIIVEVKYNSNDDNLIDTVTRFFPFRSTKSSKYVTGIESSTT